MNREAKIREARRLRGLGWTATAIGRELGVSDSTIRNWYLGGDCKDCGAPIAYGSRSRCIPCYQLSVEAPHGTVSRYRRPCRCAECTRANTAYQRTLKGKPVPKHGYSGYVNYGCRCEVCRAAHSEYLRTSNHKQFKQAWIAKVRGTEPRRHGTLSAYRYFACRCAECRAANTASHRSCRARRNQAA